MARITCPSCGAKFEPPPLKKAKGKADGFDRWWKACPPKGRARADKRRCLKFWRDNLLADIEDAVVDYMERCVKSNDWRKDGGQFVPGVYRWLQDEKWLDETYITDIGGPSKAKVARKVRVIEQGAREASKQNTKLVEVEAMWRAATDAERTTAMAEVARSPVGRSDLPPRAKLGMARAALARRKRASKETNNG